MALGFPLYINLHGNNCVVLGGGDFAYQRAKTLLDFGAKVTVISPTLCEEMQRLDEENKIRYIPRRYFRGDCTCAYLCVAATEDESLNVAISDECKAKGIPVNVLKPVAFGTFYFPSVVLTDALSISISGKLDPAVVSSLRDQIEQALPAMLEIAQETAESDVSIV